MLALVNAGSLYLYKRAYGFGYKAGKSNAILQKNISNWNSNNANTFPHDPNKPTIRMMTINCGDEIPPQMNEIAPIHEVIREKYNIEYVDKDPDILLNGFLGKHPAPKDSQIIKIFYTSEVYLDNDPPKYLDTYDLVIGFDFIETPNYIRIPFQYTALNSQLKHDYDRQAKCNPNKEHFACFLVSNNGEWRQGKFQGAQARTKMFHRLSLYKKVLSGGKHLNNVGGPVPDAQEFLSQCKFTLAYENTLNYPGYVTEKPFNAWLAGTVPIYNTDPVGLVDINKKAVIYAGDFKTEEELVDYIIKVDNDDKLYCDIWNQQIIDNPENDYEVIKSKLRIKLNEIFEKKLRK